MQKYIFKLPHYAGGLRGELSIASAAQSHRCATIAYDKKNRLLNINFSGAMDIEVRFTDNVTGEAV